MAGGQSGGHECSERPHGAERAGTGGGKLAEGLPLGQAAPEGRDRLAGSAHAPGGGRQTRGSHRAGEPRGACESMIVQMIAAGIDTFEDGLWQVNQVE